MCCCSRKLEEVQEMVRYNNIDMICMDSTHLVTSLTHETQEWIQLFGKLLHEMAKDSLHAMQSKLDRFSDDLITDPGDLEDLKSVLQVCRLVVVIVVALVVLGYFFIN